MHSGHHDMKVKTSESLAFAAVRSALDCSPQWMEYKFFFLLLRKSLHACAQKATVQFARVAGAMRLNSPDSHGYLMKKTWRDWCFNLCGGRFC